MENPTDPTNAPSQNALRRRYRKMMAWMVLATVTAVLGSLAYLYAAVGSLPIHMVIATVAGVGMSVLLGSALMLLVFISNASGHDDVAGVPPDA